MIENTHRSTATERTRRAEPPRRSRSSRAPVLAAVGFFSVAALVFLLPFGQSTTASQGPGLSAAPHVAAYGGNLHVVKTWIGGWGVENATPGSVTEVDFSFAQPHLTCNASQPEQQSLATGAGLWDSNFSVHLATGVFSICKVGASSPIYQPAYTHEANRTCQIVYDGCKINSLTVSPGDAIAGTITWHAGNVSFTLSDLTTNQSFSNTLSVSGLTPNLALCFNINFKDMPKFSKFFMTCHATIGGVSHGFGKFHAPATLIQYQLVSNRTTGAVPLSSTSALCNNKASFSFTWLRSEPS